MSKKKDLKLARHVVDAITNGTICNMIKSRDTNECVRSVDFSAVSPQEDPYGFGYTINVSSAFPDKRDDLVCIFPNHKTEKKRVLKSNKYWSGTSYNVDVNSCISESLDRTDLGGSIKLAIAYGDQIYVCKDISGTAYILWATINRKNPGNVPCTMFKDQPILFNLDGQGSLKSLFILRPKVEHVSNMELLPLAYMNPILFWPEKPIFVCEVRPQKMEIRPLTTISKRMAKQRVSAQTKNAASWLRFERNGLDEEDIETATENKLIGMSEADLTEEASWADTGDEDMFTPRAEKPLRFQKVSSPRIIRSRGVGPRNPFDSDNEDEKQVTVDEEEESIREQVGLAGDGNVTDIVIL